MRKLLPLIIALFCIPVFCFAGEVVISLNGINPLSVNVRGNTQDEEANSFSIFLYFGDDGVTELTEANVNSNQLTTSFGWGNGFETKVVEVGPYDRGGHIFAKRLNYANVNLQGECDDLWPTAGVNALICTFTTVGNGHVYIETQGGDALADCSYQGHIVTIENQDTSLPIELSIFKAEVSSTKVVLNWTTESEINNLGFEIYRALEEEADYVLLSSYKTNTSLTGQGNSSTRYDYSYIDESAEAEKTYWYKLADLDYMGVKTFHGPVSATAPKAIPEDFKLRPNYPNPFNPSTTIRFDIPLTDNELVATQLIIFNILGQVTKTLYQDKLSAGSYEVHWDGTTNSGNNAPSGIYYLVFRANNFSQTGKLVLLK